MWRGLLFNFGSGLLLGALAQGGDSDSKEGLPPCETCAVYQAYWTETWGDYHTIAATATDDFHASIAASFKSDEDYTIRYVTALPTSVITINDTYSVTITCCEPWAYASVSFEYWTMSSVTRRDGKVTSIGDDQCSPTSTYFVPDSTVVYKSVPKGKVTLAPSNTCEIQSSVAESAPETKTIVARLIPETEGEPEIQTDAPGDLPEDTPAAEPQSSAGPAQGEPTGGSSAGSGGGGEGGSGGDEDDDGTPDGDKPTSTDSSQKPPPPADPTASGTGALSGDSPTATPPFESIGSKLQIISCMLLSFLLTAFML